MKGLRKWWRRLDDDREWGLIAATVLILGGFILVGWLIWKLVSA